MIFEIFVLALTLLFSLVFQLTAAPYAEIFGVGPDLVFACVAALGAYGGFLRGSVYGAGVGFLMDVMFLSPGMYSLQYTLTGVVTGLFSSPRMSAARAAAIAVPVYALKELAVLFTQYLRRVAVGWSDSLLNILIGAAYTALMVLLYSMLFARLRKNAGFFGRDDIL